MLFLTIRIRLICQKWNLIETASETYKCQMYGHNVGQPIIMMIRIEKMSQKIMITNEQHYITIVAKQKQKVVII